MRVEFRMDAAAGSGYLRGMERYIKDARRAVRYGHDSMLEILDDPDPASSPAARLVDVSSTGVSFTSLRVLRRGAVIRGRLRILGAGVLVFSGTVVRVKARTNTVLYGVAFDSVKGKS